MKQRSLEQDANGNVMSIGVDGKITLMLKDKRPLYIGDLISMKDGSTVYAKREKIADIFRKNNSWGINRAILAHLHENDKVVITDDAGRIFVQTKKVILEKGQHLLFKQQGLELRIFLPLEEWDRVGSFDFGTEDEW